MTIFSWIGEIFSENARHNAELERRGLVNRREVRLTTVGWRRDPINNEDGQTHDPHGPSHNRNGEYYTVIRRDDRRKRD